MRLSQILALEPRADGRELYYLDPDSRVMPVSLTLPASPAGIVEHGAPTRLFTITPEWLRPMECQRFPWF